MTANLKVKLNNAVDIPLLGTEKAVGQAIKESGIPREEIFVTTKLPLGCENPLKRAWQTWELATSIWLYLVHWPQPIAYYEGYDMPKNPDGSYKTEDNVSFNDTWAEVEKLLDTGKVRAIGVSNFSVKTLEQLFTTAKIVPAVNQVELHPYLAQNDLRDHCTRKGIVLTAYTPSGYSVVRGDPLIVSLAEKYKVTTTQVILAWHVSRKTVLVPTSKDSTRQKENLTIPNISEVDLAKIWHLDHGQRICNAANPQTGQVWGWTLEQLGWESFYAKFAMSANLKVKLNNAVDIPLLGTEKAVGQAIKESGIPREEIFVTTKLPWHHQTRVRESFEESLADLGTGYIDLYLVHWPQPIAYYEGNDMAKNPDGSYKTEDNVSFNDTWAEVEKLLDTGKVRAIGVSNFSAKTLEQLFTTAKIVPVVNQVELHPYLAQNDPRDYCTRKGIVLTEFVSNTTSVTWGYSVVRGDPLIVSLAEKYKVTPTQVILAWHVARKSVLVPISKDRRYPTFPKWISQRYGISTMASVYATQRTLKQDRSGAGH
ncbi:hypothetical protein CVT25_009947 [Psilocybe cyanescens]|uniref:NADP-dependent oxidoreductase domain-containing protein n=1 Tax=Psilocybe cyanescens TaxID=93625 RepID=A0A409XD18_PSICY|nr:hypothetical protein CVT25_009947 [Psilocybe cyanescens]